MCICVLFWVIFSNCVRCVVFWCSRFVGLGWVFRLMVVVVMLMIISIIISLIRVKLFCWGCFIGCCFVKREVFRVFDEDDWCVKYNGENFVLGWCWGVVCGVCCLYVRRVCYVGYVLY